MKPAIKTATIKIKKAYVLILIALFIFFSSFGQSIMTPTDTVINYYTLSTPPTQPAYGQIGKWVHSQDLYWNTNEYKCYIYKGCPFRLHFPRSYNPNANDGKKYPMLVFFHGLGEVSSNIYENDAQLLHGGDVFQAAIDNGTFDGYALFMQVPSFWNSTEYQNISEIIDYMIANNKLDGFAVNYNGLSAGGSGAWGMMFEHPAYTASDIPMSAVSLYFTNPDSINKVKYIPIWNVQGGQDAAPAPYTAHVVRDAYVAAGANYTYTEFSTLGHDTWDSTWLLPDYWPFLNRAYSSNPTTLYGRTRFCPGDTINLTLGLSGGYQAYQWRMNGNVITGAITNTIQVTQAGTYDARVQRNGIWSDWSHAPVNIIVQGGSPTPPIQVSGLMSDAIPAADGKNYINLQVSGSNTYTSYTWKKVGSDSVLSTSPVFKATQPGFYIVAALQQYACSALYSSSFKVIDAKGPNAPNQVKSLTANATSYTKVQLSWSPSANQVNTPAALEIYRGTASGSYGLIAQVGAAVKSYVDSNLSVKTKYYYTVRAIDSTGAAALSNEATAITLSDTLAPSLPANLKMAYSTPASAAISWTASTDNITVDHYNIYVNGKLSNVTNQTSFVLNAITPNQTYTVYVKAVDAAGNVSAQSNQVAVSTGQSNLKYSVYSGTWSVLPDFTALKPVATGSSSNVDITVTILPTFGMMWQGYLNVPVSGTYTFYTVSDDGSKFWFNSYTPAGTPTVNNDGAHAAQAAVSTQLTLQAGIYPICAEYFQAGGGLSMSLYWMCSNLFTDGNPHIITNNYFVSNTNAIVPQPAKSATPGLKYSYYPTTTSWTKLPDFTKLTPTATGISTNTDLSIAKDNLYGIVWTGYITIPVTGTYTFYTISDDGSALYFNSSTPTGTPTVNNDGAHAAQGVAGTQLTLQAGTYPICMDYFQAGGGYSMTTYWACPQLFGDANAHAIDNNYFTAIPATPSPALPALPTSGLKYSYYPTTTSWSKLPDFTKLTPTTTGTVANVDLSMAKDNLYGVVWQGYINVPVAGTYTFYTVSDDGSALYFNSSTPTGTPTVNNDGAHAMQGIASAQLTLQPGIYPVCIDYFQAGGGYGMNVYWSCSQLFNDNNAHLITSNYFGSGAGVVPVIPSALTAIATAYNKINLSWADNSNNETSFEIYRSTSSTGTYNLVGTVPANTTSFVDSGLNASTAYYYKIQAAGLAGGSGLTGTVAAKGIAYAFYPNSIFQNASTKLNVIDNFTPQSTGAISTVSVAPSVPTLANYAIKYAGNITVPVTGNYTFYAGSDDGTNLYIGGYDSAHLVVKNDGWQAYTEKSGMVTLNAGTYPYYVTYWQSGGAATITTSWIVPGKTKTTIPDSVLSYQPSAVTLAAPATPLAPSSSTAVAVSASKINLTWAAVTGATGYQLYRSIGDNTNYVLINTLSSTALGYSDSGLNANTVHYYQIKATGIGGTVSVPSIASATTKDNAPVIAKLAAAAVPYGATSKIVVNATDVDGDALTFTTANLPSFVSVANNGTNSIVLVANPAQSNFGVYNNLKVFAADAYNGKDSTTFTLTVNSNYSPTIDTIANYILNENDSISIALSAHDQNAGDKLTWSLTGLPAAYNLIDNGDGTATLGLHPNYIAAGTYNPIVTVNDGNGGVTTRTFNLVVKDKTPTTNIYVRFQYNTPMGTPWNSITGTTTNNLVDDGGKTTNVGLALQTSWLGLYNSGVTTGNNSGVYPDAVLADDYYFGIYGGPDTVVTKVTGLDTSKIYNLTFFGASNFASVPDNGSTIYAIGNQSVTLRVQGNTQNTVSINGVKPAADGTITYTMYKAANTPIGYINALVISSTYDDGSVPAIPTSLAAQNGNGSAVNLSWTDAAFNETGYYIYRALTSNQTYSLIGQATANATSFTDTSANGNIQYSYKIAAFNLHGISAYSNIAIITTADRVPQINPVSDVVIKSNQTATINIIAKDDATDHITFTILNLPSFAKFTDNGNGTGTINVSPAINNVGGYFVTVTATDNSNVSSTASFNILVSDPNISSTYLSFSDGVNAVPKPWNMIAPYPLAGFSFSNLNDDSNTSTGITLTFQNGFQGGVAESGMQPVNGAGIYPNVVMRTGNYDGSNTKDTIILSGLSTSKLYNFVFFNSHDDGKVCTTNFTIGNTTVTLNATANISKTVQINGITPDATGKVYVVVQKAANADFAFISTMIIQSYAPAYTTIAPANLRITTITRNSIALQWQDRSNSESSYQIWRAADSVAGYTLLNTVAANTTSYIDSNLTSNKTYNYVVRAVYGSAYSNFSNAVKASTYAYSVYLNFTGSNNAPMPWNNTDAPPQVGLSLNNFYDEKGTITSTGIYFNTAWAGLSNLGLNPLNNSGIYPDSVNIDSYTLFPGQSATFQITGLNIGMKYDFTFFASHQAYADINAAYTINGITTILDASLNLNGTQTIYGVAPDNNGNVTVTVSAGDVQSLYYLLGAMVIGGYTPSASTVVPALPAGSQTQSIAQSGSSSNSIAKTANNNKEVLGEVKAFPNPFHDNFILSVDSKKSNNNIQVALYDVTGKIVYSNQFHNLFNGLNALNVMTNKNLGAGVYILVVRNADTKESKSIKLIKR